MRPERELDRLTSRFVAPVDVAPHVAGAAVDLTLVDVCGDALDLGTPIDATPEQSDGRCWFAAAGIGADARAHRDLLRRVLEGQGLVNYPTEWWHWSFGDRYWALLTGARARAVRAGRRSGGGMTGLAVATRTERASGPLLEVDLSAVAANTALFAARATGRLMAVVKADGFGHGAVDGRPHRSGARRDLARSDRSGRGLAAARRRPRRHRC